MRNCERTCQKMLIYRPPSIAIAFLVVATLLHFLPAFEMLHLKSSALAGASVGALGFGIMIRAWWLFQRHKTAICPTAETTSLITVDIYAYTRNPMYLGMVIMLFGIAVYAGSWPYHAATFLYALVLNHVFCHYEEAKLLHQYGRQYSDYAARVRRWL